MVDGIIVAFIPQGEAEDDYAMWKNWHQDDGALEDLEEHELDRAVAAHSEGAARLARQALRAAPQRRAAKATMRSSAGYTKPMLYCRPFQRMSCDLVGPLTTTRAKTVYILTCNDARASTGGITGARAAGCLSVRVAGAGAAVSRTQFRNGPTVTLNEN